MISVRFQGKPFNITVIQVYAPASNTEEQFYEDLQDLLELTPKEDVLFIIRDWNAKVGSQETPGVTGKFGLGVQNEAGQRLIAFCQENALVIANTLFQQHKEDSTHGHHQMVNTEIRSIIFFAAKDGEALSVQFSCSVVSDSLQPQESQHARPPCPSPTPEVRPFRCVLNRFSRARLFATPWTAAHQAPLSVGSSRQRY